MTRLDADSLLAVLNVPPATADFAGNYSCGSPSLQMASVTLHVLNGMLTQCLSCNFQYVLVLPICIGNELNILSYKSSTKDLPFLMLTYSNRVDPIDLIETLLFSLFFTAALVSTLTHSKHVSTYMTQRSTTR